MSQTEESQALPDLDFPEAPKLGPSFGSFLGAIDQIKPIRDRESSSEERQSLMNLWFELVRICKVVDDLHHRAENAHQVVMLVDRVKHHGGELEGAIAAQLNQILKCSLDQRAVLKSRKDLFQAVDLVEKSVARLSGFLKKEHKVKLENRLDRFFQEGLQILDVMDSVTIEMDTAYRPFAVRRQVLSDLIVSLQIIIPKANSLSKCLSLPHIKQEWKDKIAGDQADLIRWYKQIKKWRDNPSQRLGVKVKDCTYDLARICQEYSELKEACYQECLSIGMVFYDRCNRIR